MDSLLCEDFASSHSIPPGGPKHDGTGIHPDAGPRGRRAKLVGDGVGVPAVIAQRIDRIVIPLYHEVQVRAGRPAGRAFEADLIADVYQLMQVDEQLVHVAVDRGDAVAMVDLDRPAQATYVPTRPDHFAGLRP